MEWLKAPSPKLAGGREIKVDRDNNIIRGMVVAQEGDFKSQGRGAFDGKSLRTIAQLMRREPKGLKSRFTHPDLSSDGLGKFLGRAREPFMDSLVDHRGDTVEAVRADLHVSETAFNTPSGDLATYILDLAEQDPDALSSSLVLAAEEVEQLDRKGEPLRDEEGNVRPPIWRPTDLHATDIVDTGDAVDGLLSAHLSIEGLPDEIVRKASEMLRTQFAGKDRAFVFEHLSAWTDRVLDHYWPEDEPEELRHEIPVEMLKIAAGKTT